MKLLIDEMYPPAIAEQLCCGGHDADAVSARAELRALPDEELFAVAQQEQRVVVTENIADFSLIVERYYGRGHAHHGLILVSPARYPRGKQGTIGRMVSGLDGLLREHPTEEPTSLHYWL